MNMKKIIAMIIALTFVCLSAFTLCAFADGTTSPAYKMTLTGPSIMVVDEWEEFTVKVGNIATATSGLKSLKIVLTYSDSDFVNNSTLEWSMPAQSWKQKGGFSSDNGITTITLEPFGATTGSDAITSGEITIKFSLKLKGSASASPAINIITLSGTAVTASYGEVKGESTNGVGITVKRALNRAATPGAPVLQSKDPVTGSVTLERGENSTGNLEFSWDRVNWRSTKVFTGLDKNGKYNFYARVAADGDTAASLPSEPLTVIFGEGNVDYTTGKTDSGSGSTDPSTEYEPEIISITESRIIVKAVTGYEYSLDASASTWSTSGVFTNLMPSTVYNLFWRKVGETYVDAKWGLRTSARALGKAPAPTVKTVTETSIELNAVTGCEYSIDGKSWQVSPLFTGLENNRVYILYQRYAKTDSNEAGETSDPITATTKKVCAHANVSTTETKATCTENGLITKKCNDCGQIIYTESVAAKGHDWAWNEVPATCTEAGKKEHYCKNCGAYDQREIIPAKGHTPGAAATCTEPQKCTVCNAVIAAAKGHTPGEPATCTTPQKCLVCYEVLSAAKGHTPAGEATCTEPQKCLVCGEVLSAAKGHVEGEAIVEVEPTRKKEGSRVTKCSVCGEVVKREVIPKVGGSNTIVTVVIVLAIFAVIAAGGAVFFILSKGNGTGAGGAGKKTGGRASINK